MRRVRPIALLIVALLAPTVAGQPQSASPGRRPCAFRLMCRRGTTSRSTTTSPFRCATASSCSPMSIARPATGAIPSSSRRPPTAPNAFPAPTRRPSTSRGAATSTCFQDVRGRHESDGRWEPFFDDREGWLRHRRMGGQAAVVQRQGRDAGRLVSRAEPVAGRAGRAAEPGHDLSDGRVHEHLSRLDHAERRLAAVVQFRLGTGAQESRIMQNPGPHTLGRACDAIHYDEVQWHLPLDTMQQLVGRNAAVLRRLARASRLRRLLEAAQRRGACSTRSPSRSIRSAAGSTSSARARCAATSG